ncbi:MULTISPECIES: hypothetical protein [Paenibacillus]|uniref:hypothetical protein n=1 Tax=Paenibacillus TaxID=44249 RepID=UPI0022B87D1D|nr:hypothetical protein [Paenibacillus caseinilyticus]MCZ8518546.1 hypothetical protein [Paenibacillus caseinilyticus]
MKGTDIYAELKGTDLHIRHIRFGSFIKWNVYASAAFGALLGIPFSLLSMITDKFVTTFNGMEVTGIQEILFVLLLIPVTFILMGVLASVGLYLPLVLLLKLTKGIRLRGDYEIRDGIAAENLPPEEKADNETEHLAAPAPPKETE